MGNNREANNYSELYAIHEAPKLISLHTTVISTGNNRKLDSKSDIPAKIVPEQRKDIARPRILQREILL